MMASDFLLELLSEEIPARMQGRARNDLARLFAEELERAGLAHEGITTWSTPRRLALIARGVPQTTEAVREEVKGPRVAAPPQALEGFLRKTGLTREQLEHRDGVLFAVIDRPGRAAVDVLAEAVATIVRTFPWAKSMRWGPASASTASLRWVRPLHSIVAILGEEIVPVAIQGVPCGATTLGHRFHHPGPITMGGAFDYAEKLRACHVIVDHEERERIVREEAGAAAAVAGLTLVEDEGLVVENAGLTEWPVPLLGRFDPDYLDVPREVIVLTMRTNQKYFACTDETGALAPAFVCTANIDANDGGAAIIEGNRRVLAARLSDARFFWEQDVKVPLDEQAKKLSGIVFHEKLGTVADKVERVAKLARWLVEEGIVGSSPARGGGPPAQPVVEGPHGANADLAEDPLHHPADGPPPRAGEELADLAERAARLAKADLVTGMVGEFPELQGIIGGYLAAAQGEPKAVSDAIRDHYKPVGQGDEVPTAPVTVAVSLADKLDTIVGFFCIGERPTGSKDPYALRRAALGAIHLILQNGIRAELEWLDSHAIPGFIRERFYADMPDKDYDEAKAWLESFDTSQVPAFIVDRLKVQQKEAGIRHDLIDAVFALDEMVDLIRLLARVNALQSFVETPDGTDLLAAYKRAANILKKENWSLPRVMSDWGHEEMPQTGEEDPLVLVEEPAIAEAVAAMALGSSGPADAPAEERALVAALDAAEPRAQSAVEAEDFTGAMAALASLRTPIDVFFDKVTVNDPDPSARARRLNLLARFRDAVHRVADFSKIEG
ncbi:MAG: glycine--tRNA ligase subunit beta [Sphingomicrobium sp.]|nr:glycine--tRNA ligase subunit beta [Sphingomonadales bacterium]